MARIKDDDYPPDLPIRIVFDCEEVDREPAEITYHVNSWQEGQDVLEAMHEAARDNGAVVKKRSFRELDFKPV